MTMTSRALVAVLAVGAFTGCGDDTASPSDDGSTTAEGTTGGDPGEGSTASDPATTGGTDGGPTSSTGPEGSTSTDASSSGGEPETDTDAGADTDTDTDGTSSGGESSSSTGSQISGGESTTGAVEAFCGDGFIDEGEECDAGIANDDGGDCTASCTVNVCGDGFLHAANESCDDGNDDNTDGCVSCLAASCGDGFTQLGVETCDDGNANNLDACHTNCSAHEVVELALGGDFTCALFDSSMVKCWGNAASGRLGYGNTEDVGDDETPADVGFLDLGADAAVESIAAGVSHTCLALQDGSLRCFGAAAVGQIGYGNTVPLGDNESILSVDAIDFGSRIASIGSGGGAFHSCVALDSGDVKCWGQAASGKLGIVGQTTNIGDNEQLSSSPVTDVGAPVAQLAAGQSHTCARTDLGTVRCWGSQANGALGYGNPNAIGDDETPASAGDVVLTDFASDLAVGWNHSCVVLEGGDVQCWGRGNDGRLGYGDTAYVGFNNTPADAGTVELDGPARTVVAGFAHTCALLQDQTVQCWGYGANGQLGYGSTDTIGNDETPADAGVVPLDITVRSVAADGNHTCVITTAGTVRCWGQGSEGRLGYGNTENLGDDESLVDLPDVPLFATSGT